MFCKDLLQTVHLWGGIWTSNGIAHTSSRRALKLVQEQMAQKQDRARRVAGTLEQRSMKVKGERSC